MDLSLYLIEKMCGYRAAVESAKTMVLDLGRRQQTPYGAFLSSKAHSDSLVMRIEQQMLQNHTGDRMTYLPFAFQTNS